MDKSPDTFFDTDDVAIENITLGKLYESLKKCAHTSKCVVLEAFILANFNTPDARYLCELMSNMEYIDSIMGAPLQKFDIKCAIHNNMVLAEHLGNNPRFHEYISVLLERAIQQHGNEGNAGKILLFMINEQKKEIQLQFEEGYQGRKCVDPYKKIKPRGLQFRGNWNNFCPPHHIFVPETRCCKHSPKRRLKVAAQAVDATRKWTSLSKYSWKWADIKSVVEQDPNISKDGKKKMKEDWENAQEGLEKYLESLDRDKHIDREWSFMDDVISSTLRKAEVFVKKHLSSDLETRKKLSKANWLSLQTLEWAVKRGKDQSLNFLFYCFKHPKFITAILLVLERVKGAVCYKMSLKMGLLKGVEKEKANALDQTIENAKDLKNTLMYFNEFAALLTDPETQVGIISHYLTLFFAPLHIIPGYFAVSDILITTVAFSMGEGLKEWIWLTGVTKNFGRMRHLVDVTKCLRQIEVDFGQFNYDKDGNVIMTDPKEGTTIGQDAIDKDPMFDKHPWLKATLKFLNPEDAPKARMYFHTTYEDSALTGTITLPQAVEEVAEGKRNGEDFKNGIVDGKKKRAPLTDIQQSLFDIMVWEYSHPNQTRTGPRVAAAVKGYLYDEDETYRYKTKVTKEEIAALGVGIAVGRAGVKALTKAQAEAAAAALKAAQGGGVNIPRSPQLRKKTHSPFRRT